MKQHREDILSMAIEELVCLEDIQVRRQTDPKIVRRYALEIKHGANFPPVIATELAGVLVLLDGFHRIAAYRANGENSIQVQIVDAHSLEDAKWRAAQANLTHGVSLKTSELRGVFRAYVGARQHRIPRGKTFGFKPYRKIAEELGGRVAYSTVRNWMKSDFPSVFRAMGDGDLKKTDGGLRPTISAQGLLVRDSHAALDHVAACVAGVTDPRIRYSLWEKVSKLEALLSSGEMERPDF